MGITEMHWAFDPFQVRNAHFNLNVLGARAVSLERNLYGTYGHGLDVQNTTDRLRAVWDLTSSSSRVIAPVAGDPLASVIVAGKHASLVVPVVTSRQLDETQRRLRHEVLDGFDELFAQDLAAVRCDRVGDDRAVYTFEGVGAS
jgi:predicted GNAT superfamily acetyltransferase